MLEQGSAYIFKKLNKKSLEDLNDLIILHNIRFECNDYSISIHINVLYNHYGKFVIAT